MCSLERSFAWKIHMFVLKKLFSIPVHLLRLAFASTRQRFSHHSFPSFHIFFFTIINQCRNQHWDHLKFQKSAYASAILHFSLKTIFFSCFWLENLNFIPIIWSESPSLNLFILVCLPHICMLVSRRYDEKRQILWKWGQHHIKCLHVCMRTKKLPSISFHCASVCLYFEPLFLNYEKRSGLGELERDAYPSFDEIKEKRY